MGKRDRPLCRAFTAGQLDELRGLILALQQHQPTTQTSTQTSTPEEPEVKGLFSAFKRFWNEIEAVYNPRLVAISDHGIIIDWIDERTGEKPWFS